MPDYKKGKIYAIRSHQTNDIYIGSTCQSLCYRMSGHRVAYKRFLNGNTTCIISSFQILQHGDAYIELFEVFPCESRQELHKKEGQIIRQLECVNKCIPGRTKQEWCNDNKDKLTEYYQQYYQDNKAVFQEKHTQYYENNRDTIIDYNKELYKSKKIYINQYQSTVIECECGHSYTRSNRARHMRTAKHTSN